MASLQPGRFSAGQNVGSRFVVWSRSALVQGILGSLLLWAAFPPCDLWPLAWLAPIPWLLLIRRKNLAGRHPYLALWIAGLTFWLPAIHWIRLPHWTTYLGWMALSGYLACYLPVFVGLSRVAVHHMRVPLMLAAPMIWTGLELARAHLLTGFLMVALGHTQYRWATLIQISDLAGAYAVSFLIMFAAASLARMLPCETERLYLGPVIPLIAVIGLACIYGFWRLSYRPLRPGPRVALIQGSIDPEWKADPQRAIAIIRHYFDLSKKAVTVAGGQVDLIVWPESMFRRSLFSFNRDDSLPEETVSLLEKNSEIARQDIANMVAELGVPVLLGMEVQHYTSEGKKRFNSAIMVDKSGCLVGRYDKNHLVMFGEYIPLGDMFPWLYRLSPMGAGVTAGLGPTVMELDGVRYAPNICFESVLPHKIRQQVLLLGGAGRSPDVLVNLTNDAWFWGSSELPLHLACGVFRAVEFRRPFLVAANSGISAWISSGGKIRKNGPRRAPRIILAQVGLDDRKTVYLTLGDWFSGFCLMFCLVTVFGGLLVIGRNRGDQLTHAMMAMQR